ncbi:MAG: ATP-binding cassette domain-containing protein [Lachnospiraceae bacterium]|nr:ATP-binding cassette domain-containing protein [Lachnospiraceae bacterium]
MKLTITHVSKKIQDSTVLNDVNMTLEGGTVYGLLGKNGSGKTMLMRAICGLISPTNGTIEIDGMMIGKDISFPKNMGMLLETPVFLPERTGYENLRLLASIRREITSSDIKRVLEQVGLNAKDKRKVRKYSLGMRQRLGIACAIMEKPSLLLLDEPFNGLDESGCQLVQQIICEQREKGCLILLACHDREELETLSDCIYRVENGRFSVTVQNHEQLRLSP